MLPECSGSGFTRDYYSQGLMLVRMAGRKANEGSHLILGLPSRVLKTDCRAIGRRETLRTKFSLCGGEL